MANYSGSHDYVDGTLSTTSDEDGTPRLSGLMAMLLGVDANDRGGIVLAGSLFERSIDASLDGLLDVVMVVQRRFPRRGQVDRAGDGAGRRASSTARRPPGSGRTPSAYRSRSW